MSSDKILGQIITFVRNGSLCWINWTEEEARCEQCGLLAPNWLLSLVMVVALYLFTCIYCPYFYRNGNGKLVLTAHRNAIITIINVHLLPCFGCITWQNDVPDEWNQNDSRISHKFICKSSSDYLLGLFGLAPIFLQPLVV